MANVSSWWNACSKLMFPNFISVEPWWALSPGFMKAWLTMRSKSHLGFSPDFRKPLPEACLGGLVVVALWPLRQTEVLHPLSFQSWSPSSCGCWRGPKRSGGAVEGMVGSKVGPCNNLL